MVYLFLTFSTKYSASDSRHGQAIAEKIMNPLEDIKLQDLAIMYEFDEVYTGIWAGGKILGGKAGGTGEVGIEGEGEGTDGRPTSATSISSISSPSSTPSSMAGELGLSMREGGLQISMSRVVGARNQRYNLRVTLSNG